MKKILRAIFEFILIYLVIFIILASVSFVVISNFFQIKTIYIESGNEIVADVAFFEQKRNLFFLQESSYTDELLKKYTHIKEVTITKKYPQTLIVRFNTRKPIATVIFQNIRKNVDADGYILNSQYADSLPIIDCETTVKDSIIESQNILQTLMLLEALKKVHIGPISKISCVADLFIISLLQFEVTVFVSQDPISIASSLQFLIKQFTINDSWPKAVDMRFDKEVIIP